MLPLLRSAVPEEERGVVAVCEERGVVRGERSMLRGDVCGEAEGLRCPPLCEEGTAVARPLGERCAVRAVANPRRTKKAMRR